MATQIFMGDMRKADDPETKVDTVLMGDGPFSASENYDLVVISGIKEELTAEAIALLEQFYADGGCVLWIYDIGFEPMNTNFNLVSSHAEISDGEGFNIPTGVTHDLLNGLSQAADFVWSGLTLNISGRRALVRGGFRHLDENGNHVLYVFFYYYIMPSWYAYCYSYDGTTWTQLGSTSETASNIFAVGDTFYYSTYSTFTSRIISSTDFGLNWNVVYGPFTKVGYNAGQIESMHYFDGKMYVLVRYAYKAPNYPLRVIYSSSDMSSWTEEYSIAEVVFVRTLPVGIYGTRRTEEFDGYLYFGIGCYEGGTYNTIVIRTDGSGSWTTQTTLTTGDICCFNVFKNKLYITTSDFSTTSPIYLYNTDDGSLFNSVTSWAATTPGNDHVCRNLETIDGYQILTRDENASRSTIWTSRSYNGEDWEDEAQDISPDEHRLPSRALFGYLGKIYIGGDSSLNPSLFVSPTLSPIYAEVYQAITGWTDKGADVYEPDPGQAYLMSWRHDSDHQAIMVAYQVGLARYVHFADSNLFTNSAPGYDINFASTLLSNIFTWLLNKATKRVLWLTGEWVGGDTDGWMDIESAAPYGAANLVPLLGTSQHQEKTDISQYIEDGGLGITTTEGPTGHPAAVYLGNTTEE